MDVRLFGANTGWLDRGYQKMMQKCRVVDEFDGSMPEQSLLSRKNPIQVSCDVSDGMDENGMRMLANDDRIHQKLEIYLKSLQIECKSH